MSRGYREYENDFLEILSKAKHRTTSEDLSQVNTVLDIREMLLQGGKLLKQLEIELTLLPLSLQTSLSHAAEQHRKSFSQLLSYLNSQERSLLAKKSSELLFCGPTSPVPADSGSLLHLIHSSSSRSAATMNSVKSQREQLQAAPAAANSLKSEFSLTAHSLRSLHSRSLIHKSLLLFLILLQVFAIGVVLYLNL